MEKDNYTNKLIDKIASIKEYLIYTDVQKYSNYNDTNYKTSIGPPLYPVKYIVPTD
tara:strand:- start:323 stop:490 length:168 start_codon:yes stop_codon:yes gene_type:complete